MKKIIAFVSIFAVALGSAFSAQGQEFKHELGISYGALSNSLIIDDFENAIITGLTTSDVTFGHNHYAGPIAVDYFYRVSPLVGVGAIGAFGVNTQNVIENKVKNGKIRHNYYTVMPAVKLDWLRKEKFGMYSKLAIGGTLRTENFDPDNGESDTDTQVHLNWQVSLVGFEVGGVQTRGFLELGTGEQGVLVLGMRHKF